MKRQKELIFDSYLIINIVKCLLFIHMRSLGQSQPSFSALGFWSEYEKGARLTFRLHR